MLTGWGSGRGLSNRNTVGVEVVARNNRDVNDAQLATVRGLVGQNYPNIPVYGHGEVNPGHREADEGMMIVNAIPADRAVQGLPADIPNPGTQDAAEAAARCVSPRAAARKVLVPPRRRKSDG
jgi:hypothetical protein